MSSTLYPFAVRLRDLQASLGSRNNALVRAAVAKAGPEFDPINEAAAEYDYPEGEGPLFVDDAIRQLVHGEPLNPKLGFVYGWALMCLCDHLGTALPNEHFDGIGSDWFDEIDEGLCPDDLEPFCLDFLSLYCTELPIELPPIDDDPGFGYLSLDEVSEALESLTPERLSLVEDEEISDAVAELRGWLIACKDSSRDLICFYG